MRVRYLFKSFQAALGCTTRGLSVNGFLFPGNHVIIQRSSLGDAAAQNAMPTKTVRDMVDKFTCMVGASSTYSAATVDRTELLKLLPKSQDELPTRTMSDSWDSAVIPLSTNKCLREKYITFNEGVRIGRLLEDLDVFSAWLCYRHVHNPRQAEHPDLPSPYIIVTGMMDRMDFCKGVKLDPNHDIRISGHVSWTGTSSIETIVHVDQLQDGAWKKVTTAVFVFVARDPLNQGAAIINKLVPNTEEEKKIFEQGVLNKLSRKIVKEESLFKQPPNETEKNLVHELFLSMSNPKQHEFAPKRKPQGSRWISETKIKNIIMCHPEHRNRFGKVFGGFIMRKAIELAWTSALVHSGQRCTISHIDDVVFTRPVEVGSLLYLNAQVVYTDGEHMQVSTKASMMDPVTQTLSLTNIFHFTFAADSAVPPVLPCTYHEAMMYLDGRRHYQLVTGERRYYGQQESNEDRHD
ncbi:acyl-coenzyme A thioesterase 9, mitochondrial-like [Hyalella azteca]|uniref:Acyl-coenzyme A thioesterase 9, mitochondrial-like n=1 Tax=Hyalella azteca TaxID=294128 RepID=A0A8B7NG72_HYAAZ|nr:acyl-coenzyme A thioesterase 9, mitochondrial-like [Hyalella azteca]